MLFCRCAWGYVGEDCSVLKLAACRQSTEPWAPVHTGQLPKACECYRQVWALRAVGASCIMSPL